MPFKLWHVTLKKKPCIEYELVTAASHGFHVSCCIAQYVMGIPFVPISGAQGGTAPSTFGEYSLSLKPVVVALQESVEAQSFLHQHVSSSVSVLM